MKKILRALVLLMWVVSNSYGSEDRVNDPLWIWSPTSGPESTDLPIPLPHLETQEEQLARSTASLAQPKSKANQSLFELLSLRLVQKIMNLLSVRDKQTLALVSRRCRKQAQYSITHLSIPLRDLTEKKLKDIKCRFPNVKSLAIKSSDIRFEKLRSKDIKLLAQKFPFIESLDLELLNITQAEIELLAQTTEFTKLKRLNLRFNTRLGDAGITALIKTPFASQLESLDLSSTCITAVGISELSQSKVFKSLKVLNIKQNPKIGNEGLAFLVKAPFSEQLELLNLESVGLTIEGVKTLAQTKGLKALRSLYLGSNIVEIGNFFFNKGLEDDSIAVLAKASFASQLELLDLYNSDITIIGLRTLFQPNVFSSLKQLNLSANKRIGDITEGALIKTPFGRQLELLDLKWTGITIALKRKLSELDIAKTILFDS